MRLCVVMCGWLRCLDAGDCTSLAFGFFSKEKQKDPKQKDLKQKYLKQKDLKQKDLKQKYLNQKYLK